ncbi:cannabinoid receptor 2 [Gopherus flavomarginatus]|uniref:cannabinoid receptor 2 n=1 Tax=Gopherus flavomarginatus TaxID=286002 RepID=UPI0021CBE1FB|nr:cannabinoid receptor 2 [Gopherus flavomarginatus]XP_050787940.1 cannabinoid receptor 2 [Gopherus flavomarginatus]
MEKCQISNCSINTMNLTCYMVLSSPTQKTGITVLCSIVGILCVLENSLVLFLIFASPKIRKKPSYLLISSLALADVLASIVFVCSFLDFHVLNRTDSSKEIFLLKLGGVNTSFTASLGSLLLMAFDRYVCIHRPSEYKVIVTRKRAVVAMAVVWIATMFTAFLPLMGWNCCKVNSTCSELFPFIDSKYLSSWICLVMILLLCIVYAYVRVLWKAHKHTVYMEKHQTQARQRNAKMRMDIMLAKTLVMVLAIVVTCWSPVLALMTYSLFVSLNDQIRKGFAFCSTLCLVNSMVNPIVYALRSRELHSSLRNTSLRFRKKVSISEITPEADSIQKSSQIETICDDTVCNTNMNLLKA